MVEAKAGKSGEGLQGVRMEDVWSQHRGRYELRRTRWPTTEDITDMGERIRHNGMREEPRHLKIMKEELSKGSDENEKGVTNRVTAPSPSQDTPENDLRTHDNQPRVSTCKEGMIRRAYGPDNEQELSGGRRRSHRNRRQRSLARTRASNNQLYLSPAIKRGREDERNRRHHLRDLGRGR